MGVHRMPVAMRGPPCLPHAGPYRSQAKSYGPIISGALFGAGWWFWVDAVTCTPHKVPFDQYLPGIIATLALIMINCVRM